MFSPINLFRKENGKFIFTGVSKDVPTKPSEGSKMECPVCRQMFDYLVGEDTPDGGLRACERHWKPSKTSPSPDLVQKEVFE